MWVTGGFECSQPAALEHHCDAPRFLPMMLLWRHMHVMRVAFHIHCRVHFQLTPMVIWFRFLLLEVARPTHCILYQRPFTSARIVSRFEPYIPSGSHHSMSSYRLDIYPLLRNWTPSRSNIPGAPNRSHPGRRPCHPLRGRFDVGLWVDDTTVCQQLPIRRLAYAARDGTDKRMWPTVDQCSSRGLCTQQL